MTFGAQKAAAMPSTLSSSHAPHLEVGYLFLFLEFSLLIKENLKIFFLESPQDYLTYVLPCPEPHTRSASEVNVNLRGWGQAHSNTHRP